MWNMTKNQSIKFRCLSDFFPVPADIRSYKHPILINRLTKNKTRM